VIIDVGSKLRDYDIVAHLRAGGMAALFVGRRSGVAGFQKLVAIKVIHPHLAADKQFVEMFVDEALISARVDHPNIVHVEELGEVDGNYFLVMEYVHATSLSQMLGAVIKAGRRFRPEIAVHIAARVAEGLHAAHDTRGDDGHSLGVIHRDVSPQNVLISSRGHIKLIDFGIAKAKGRMQQTTSSSLKGKIGYMSPEQAYGRPLDRTSDIYALGVVLWEMLTSRRLFVADDDFALLDLVRDPAIPPPSMYNPDVSPATDRAVLKALAKNPRDRFATAHEMRRALAEALPAALILDSADLAELVWAMVGKQLDDERLKIVEASKRIRTADSTKSSVVIPLPPLESVASNAVEQLTVVHRSLASRPEEVPSLDSLPPVRDLDGQPTELAVVPTQAYIMDETPFAAPPAPEPSARVTARPQPPPPREPASLRPPALAPKPSTLPKRVVIGAVSLAVLGGLAGAAWVFLRPAAPGPAAEISPVELERPSVAAAPAAAPAAAAVPAAAPTAPVEVAPAPAEALPAAAQPIVEAAAAAEVPTPVAEEPRHVREIARPTSTRESSSRGSSSSAPQRERPRPPTQQPAEASGDLPMVGSY
jgi:serine/threonine protein kinase